MRRVLDDLTLAVTSRCQLRCQACGIWRERPRREIPASRLARMVEGLLARYRLRFVSITGGEPFLHPGIGGILRYLGTLRLRGRIARLGVYTNGVATGITLATLRKNADYLQGLNVGISLDGLERTHDALRGRGSFRRTLATLEGLARTFSASMDLEVKFTINRKNFRELADVYHLAGSCGARFSPKLTERDVTAYYHRAGHPGGRDLGTLTPGMRERVIEQIEGMIRARPPAARVSVPMLRAVQTLLVRGREAITSCRTPARSLFITSDGRVFPCLYMASAGEMGADGTLPEGFDQARRGLAACARRGECPRCLAYHGFLKQFNLRYLR